MENFFAVNLVKRFGEIKNLWGLNTPIGKRVYRLIGAYCQNTEFQNFVFYAVRKIREYLQRIISIKTERIIISQIFLGFVTIVIF
ncbi:hypothetical protein A2933_00930 [Candidatus Nomurabacteria bacterium RIFCSPLOWO2_01_FULL_46_18]|uniref:Uncharacterized protein n=1 Tax=Candidatus Nomurabacteria bacterium RIFCSPLOWO2_01_FULL_46_18 TaxID=1801783 RepID=A0A1F6XE80_9BACT|nr:MAG: hypothetical protein A2933_00930 [Candidatus Nomurabacteria bacterium RIFCSPLOWO2_01_FULL_46_18]